MWRLGRIDDVSGEVFGGGERETESEGAAEGGDRRVFCNGGKVRAKAIRGEVSSGIVKLMMATS